MELDELQKHWNAFARTDPLWAILTAPDKRNGGWGLKEFFETGKSEIDALMQSVSALNWTGRRQRALDFGCGVGRLTQALGDYFQECCGVDISEEMVRLANELNRHGTRCSYRLNTSNDLRLFSDNYFDFVYSNIVLQHVKPEYAAGYIREFVRVLAPGGLIIFQLPSEIVKHSNPVRTSTSLPESGFRASLRPVTILRTLQASAAAQIVVAVKNTSNSTWPRSSVHLGNHWLTENGTLVVSDDARAELSQNLPPGGQEQLTLTITAPQQPAVYQLELDMVQEGVSWFKRHGSETAVFMVNVEAGQSRDGEPPGKAFKARMEMYGTPLEEVVGTVIDGGGRFIEIKQDESAGWSWRSYRYCVTKDEPTGDEPPDRYYFRDYDIPSTPE